MSASPPTRSRENTRARLIDAASEVFAELGVDGASVEAICERAGFTRGAFYSNFSSKDELLLALMRDVAEGTLERVAERVGSLRSPEAASMSPAEVVALVLDVPEDDRFGTVLMSEIRTNAMRDERLAAAYLAWQEAMAARVAGIIEDLADSYRLSLRIPVADAARVLVQDWDASCIEAAIGRLDAAAATRLATSRTARLAAAVADWPGS